MTQNALVNHNPKLKDDDGVLTHSSLLGNTKPLSSYLNIAVPKILQSDLDLRLFSLELEKLLDTPELKFEFGSAIHNPLRVCNFDTLETTQCALDLSQDFGGSAQFLSQIFSQVESIKLDDQTAKFSKARFPQTSNITYVAADPTRLELPDDRYDFIYVGRLEDLCLSIDETQDFLLDLRASLSRNGVLLINFENRNRLSKWLNSSKSESKTPYLDLYSSEHETRFNLAQIESSFDHAGFSTINLSASYTSDGLVPNLLSVEYLDRSPNALNHFYRIGSISNPRVNEYLMYQAQHEAGNKLSTLASRIIVFADNDGVSANRCFDKDFCHFPGTSRRIKWRALTSKVKGTELVTKQAIQPVSVKDQSNTDTILTQDLSTQPFQSGDILVGQWLNAIRDKRQKAFLSLLRSYYSWLVELTPTNSTFLPKSAYDLLPFNIICSDSNGLSEKRKNTSYQAIDPEWQLNTNFTADFVLFRALFWFAFENRVLLADFGDQWGFHSIDAFVRYYLREAGAAMDDELVAEEKLEVQTSKQDTNIEKFIALEETIQREISETFNSGSIRHAMHQRFADKDTTSFEHNLTQVTWADSDNRFDQANTIHLEWQLSNELQTIRGQFKNNDLSKPILRIDPIQRAGLFQLTEIALLNINQDVIWQARDSQEIVNSSSLHNLNVVSDNGRHHFIASNNDPFLLIDLSGLSSLNEISSLELKLGLIYEPNYQLALSHLQALVDTQAASISRLGNKGHETQADIDLLQIKLSDLETQKIDIANNYEHLNQHLQQLKGENATLSQSLSQLQLSFGNRLLRKMASILRPSK